MSSTQTGVGTARRKVKNDWVTTESTGMRNTLRAASMPNTMPSSRLYSSESTAIEMVSMSDDQIRSMLAKSRCASSQNTSPMSGTREASLSQSICRYSRLMTLSTTTPIRKPGMNRLRWAHLTGMRARFSRRALSSRREMHSFVFWLISKSPSGAGW